MADISPINRADQARVVEATADYIERAASHFGRRFATVPVLFDLKGRNAGMYRVRGRQRWIRYNPWLFAKYFDDNLANTVPHEVAHYICDLVYGLGHTRPHGREWQALMHLFGVEPRRTCSYDLEGIPQRRQQRHTYRCGCREHQVSTVRHRRIQQGRAQYLCRSCKQPLVSIR
jgi:SprT protein